VRRLAVLLFKSFVFVYENLKMLFVYFALLLILGALIYIYGNFQISQNRQLGAALAEKIVIDQECDKIVNERETFDLKFRVVNNNNQAVQLTGIGIDKSFLEVEGATFTILQKTTPEARSEESEGKFSIWQLIESLEVRANQTKEFSEKAISKASPSTISIHKGFIQFTFNPQASIQVPCQIQVRHPS
jgi:hypothetical protein